MTDDTKHQPLPVAGYTAQSDEKVQLVNEGKQLEELVLRYLEKIQDFNAKAFLASKNATQFGEQGRYLALGKTNIQQEFMWTFRSVFNPTRVVLPGDDQSAPSKAQ